MKSEVGVNDITKNNYCTHFKEKIVFLYYYCNKLLEAKNDPPKETILNIQLVAITH